MTIDLDYRPSDYFWPMSHATHLLATVKGTERREHIRSLIEQGRVAELEGWLAQESLSEVVRVHAGRIHPRFMGGEYLPDLRTNEVEIARVSLASVTGDVISIRARRGKNRITYRVVDEYGGDTLEDSTRRSSLRPLTLGQLERLIENAGAGMDIIRSKYGWGAGLDDMAGFMSVTSPFYPELEALYTKRMTDFVEELADAVDKAQKDAPAQP